MARETAPAVPSFWRACGTFALLFIAAWLFKEQLLSWVALARRSELGPHTALHIGAPADLFIAYVKLCAALALFAVLPLLTRTRLSRQSSGPGLVELSYALLAITLPVVHFSFVPAIWRAILPIVPSQLLVSDLVGLEVSVLLLEAIGVQLAVVQLFATRARRAQGEAWRRSWLRWLLFSLATGVAAALTTPPNPTSQLIVSWPLVLLFGLATFAGRRLSAANAAESSAPAPHPPESASPYRPPSA